MSERIEVTVDTAYCIRLREAENTARMRRFLRRRLDALNLTELAEEAERRHLAQLDLFRERVDLEDVYS